MDKRLFKGVKQVTDIEFAAAQNKTGYIWFVRPSDAEEKENSAAIYLGSRQYGFLDKKSWNSILSLLQDLSESETFSETGKPIIAVSQTNGKVAAVSGSISSDNVNYTASQTAVWDGSAPDNVLDAINRLREELNAVKNTI